jgi:hypothetical protein
MNWSAKLCPNPDTSDLQTRVKEFNFEDLSMATAIKTETAVARLIASLALLATAMAPAFAAPNQPIREVPGRYTMTPADGGMVKLDTATGAVSFCTRAPGGPAADWSCAPVKDAEQALQRKIDALDGEILVLKDQLRKMDELAGIGDPSKEQPSAKSKKALPTEKDVEQAFDYFERMMKVIRERMKRLEGAEKPSTPL